VVLELITGHGVSSDGLDVVFGNCDGFGFIREWLGVSWNKKFSRPDVRKGASMKAMEVECCRICQGLALESILDLGMVASCGYFPRLDAKDDPTAPLAIVRCPECGFVQARHNYEMTELFGNSYGYRSGLNEMMKAHLEDIVGDTTQRIDFRAEDVVLDIGSNDATLLNAYAGTPPRRVGIDPTYDQFRQFYDDDILGANDFFSASRFRDLVGNKKARVVTSIAMFYDQIDPIGFAREVASILETDGLWVLEQSYLPSMIENNSFDTICHEHLAYYCLAQIEHVLSAAALKVVDIAFNDVNGGSFRIHAAHDASPFEVQKDAIALVRARELASGYATGAPFAEFVGRVEKQGAELLALLGELHAAGKVVHGYGASTKGNTLLQYLGITSEILPVIADRNEAKWGARTPGTAIPIISEARSREIRPDYYLALPWHFRAGFLKRETDFLARGGKFIFPLPVLEIV
jgi:hypothetical protein